MGQHGTAVYSDEVQRVSLTMVRASLAMSRRRSDSGSVRLRLGHEQDLVLELVTAPWKGVADRATLLRCPRCGRAARVVGYHVLTGWGCRVCGRWRYRSEAQIKATRTVALASLDERK